MKGRRNQQLSGLVRGIFAQRLVGIALRQLIEQAWIRNLFKCRAPYARVAVLTNHLCQQAGIIFRCELFYGLDANGGVAVLPLGAKQVQKSHRFCSLLNFVPGRDAAARVGKDVRLVIS